VNMDDANLFATNVEAKGLFHQLIEYIVFVNTAKTSSRARDVYVIALRL
jgi:hypothetical protein